MSRFSKKIATSIVATTTSTLGFGNTLTSGIQNEKHGLEEKNPVLTALAAPILAAPMRRKSSRIAKIQQTCEHKCTSPEACLKTQLKIFPTTFPNVEWIKSTKKEASFLVKIEKILDKEGRWEICSGIFVDLVDLQSVLNSTKGKGKGKVDKDSLYVLTNAHCVQEAVALGFIVGFGKEDKLGRAGDRGLRVRVYG